MTIIDVEASALRTRTALVRVTAASLALCVTLPRATRPDELTGPRPELDERALARTVVP